MSSVNWDDGNVARRRDDRVKFSKDKVERICVMDAQAEMAYTHYFGGYVECTAMQPVDEIDSETQQPVKVMRAVGECKIHPHCERDPDERFGARILVYTTDRDGMPLTPLNCTFKWWAFGSQHFKTLRTLRKQFGDIRMRDLIVTCTNTDYQHLQIIPANEAWWMQNEQFKNMVAERYKAACASMDIHKLLATRVPLEKQDEYIQKALEREAKYGGRDKKDNKKERGSGRGAPDASGIVFPGGMPQMGPGTNPFASLPIPASPFAANMPNLTPNPSQGSLPFPAAPSLPPALVAPATTAPASLPSAPATPAPAGSMPDLDSLLGKLGNQS